MATDLEEDVVFDLPPEQEAGTYANAFSVWHTMSDFTLDFAVSQKRRRPGNKPDPS